LLGCLHPMEIAGTAVLLSIGFILAAVKAVPPPRVHAGAAGSTRACRQL